MPSSRPSPSPSEPRSAAARALARWARKRSGDDLAPFSLRTRRIYILPTRTGLVAAVLLFLMLLAGLNYNNSLALLLCFTLAGVAMVSMHQCHRMLAGLSVQSAQADSTFAGQNGSLLLHFENLDTRARIALSLACAPCAPVQFDLSTQQSLAVSPSYQGERRGRQRIGRLELSSDAPLGLFRAWSWLHIPLDVLIYPTPAGTRPLPPPAGDARDAQQLARTRGEQEWAWLRPFQASDPPRRVAWKAYARGAPLLVAHYDAPAGAHRVLSLSDLPGMEQEQALSQLAKWVLECDRLSEPYALRLPARELPAQQGPAHRRACLEALALYPL